MPRTTPLAPRMVIRNLLVVAILLITAACGVKRQYTRNDIQGDQAAPQETTTASASDVFHPTSPFLHFGQDACLTSPQSSNVKNPFDLSTISVEDKRLMALAFSQIGTLYRPGGMAPSTGFDCSGFTSWVFSKLGVCLPRSSREQFCAGKGVSKGELRKGDLVFFGNKRHITHVGIYLEDHKFIHSSSSGDTVKISSLDEPTWQNKFAGARRFLQ